MIMRKTNCYIVYMVTICIAISISCTRTVNPREYPEGIAVIEVTDPDPAIKIEDIYDASSVELVALETTEDFLLGNIQRLAVFEDRFFIVNSDRTILGLFDRNGKFIKKLHNVGRGPREYIVISDMAVDPVSRKVIFCDCFGNKIFVCDLDLNIEQMVRTEGYSPTVIAACRNELVFQGLPYPPERIAMGGIYKESDAVLIDYNGDIVKGIIPAERNDKVSAFPGLHPMSFTATGNLLVIPGLSDLIYEVSPSLEEASPKYLLDFKMKNYKKIDYNKFPKLIKDINDIPMNLVELEREKYVYTGDHLYNTDSHLIIGYGQVNLPLCVYDKNSGKSITYDRWKVGGDEAMSTVIDIPRTSYGDRVYSAMQVIDWKYMGLKTSLLAEMSDSINKMDDFSNPVLVSFKLKDIK